MRPAFILAVGIAAFSIAMPTLALAATHEGVVTATGYAQSQIDACTNAKTSAKGVATVDATKYGPITNVRITHYGPCSCERTANTWKCAVDADYAS